MSSVPTADLVELLRLPPEAGPLHDVSMLSCGCLVLERRAVPGQPCPVCHASLVAVVGPVEPLRRLHQLIADAEELRNGNLLPIGRISTHQSRQPRHAKMPRSDSRRSSHHSSAANTDPNAVEIGLLDVLLQSFHGASATTSVHPDALALLAPVAALPPPSLDLQQPPLLGLYPTSWSATSAHSSNASAHSASGLLPVATRSSTTRSSVARSSTNPPLRSNLTQQLASVPSSVHEERERNFGRSFPRHCKVSTHQAVFQGAGLLRVLGISKLCIGTALLPDASKFALMLKDKWAVYHIRQDAPPRLLCCGLATGEHGFAWDMMQPAAPAPALLPGLAQSARNWAHDFCALSEQYLVVALQLGEIRVMDIHQQGRTVYLWTLDKPVLCLDIAPDSLRIACGVRSIRNGLEQELAMVLLLQLDPASAAANRLLASQLTYVLDYREPILHVSFLSDSLYLLCATGWELRFMVISLRNTTPRLVLLNRRDLNTMFESEGITDVQFFPDNRYMVVVLTATDGPPIVLKPNLDQVLGFRELVHPQITMRIEEAGTRIHRAAVLPRGDLVAFVRPNGTVLVMRLAAMNQDNYMLVELNRRVANTAQRHDTTVRFLPDGHRLHVVDRRGQLTTYDFAAGPPADADMTINRLVV